MNTMQILFLQIITCTIIFSFLIVGIKQIKKNLNDIKKYPNPFLNTSLNSEEMKKHSFSFSNTQIAMAQQQQAQQNDDKKVTIQQS